MTDDWFAELRKLKSAFLDHIESNTSVTGAALTNAMSAFQRYVKVNQGILKRENENLALFQRYDSFVEATKKDTDWGDKSRQLQDAIDDAISAVASKKQAVSYITYNVGTAGVFSAGSGAQVHDVAVTQDLSNHASHIDLPQLAAELARLRAAMREVARTLEEDAAVGAVAEAEKAARGGDSRRALERLKVAGKWALDVGTKIGVGIATSVLKGQLELAE